MSQTNRSHTSSRSSNSEPPDNVKHQILALLFGRLCQISYAETRIENRTNHFTDSIPDVKIRDDRKFSVDVGGGNEEVLKLTEVYRNRSIWLFKTYGDVIQDADWVIAFRGTQTIDDLYVDFHLARSMDSRTGVEYIKHFVDESILKLLEDDIFQCKKITKQSKIYFIGHSLGAAIAEAVYRRLKNKGYSNIKMCGFDSPGLPNRYRKLYQTCSDDRHEVMMIYGNDNLINNLGQAPRQALCYRADKCNRLLTSFFQTIPKRLSTRSHKLGNIVDNIKEGIFVHDPDIGKRRRIGLLLRLMNLTGYIKEYFFNYDRPSIYETFVDLLAQSGLADLKIPINSVDGTLHVDDQLLGYGTENNGLNQLYQISTPNSRNMLMNEHRPNETISNNSPENEESNEISQNFSTDGNCTLEEDEVSEISHVKTFNDINDVSPGMFFYKIKDHSNFAEQMKNEKGYVIVCIYEQEEDIRLVCEELFTQYGNGKYTGKYSSMLNLIPKNSTDSHLMLITQVEDKSILYRLWVVFMPGIRQESTTADVLRKPIFQNRLIALQSIIQSLFFVCPTNPSAISETILSAIFKIIDDGVNITCSPSLKSRTDEEEREFTRNLRDSFSEVMMNIQNTKLTQNKQTDINILVTEGSTSHRIFVDSLSKKIESAFNSFILNEGNKVNEVLNRVVFSPTTPIIEPTERSVSSMMKYSLPITINKQTDDEGTSNGNSVMKDDRNNLVS